MDDFRETIKEIVNNEKTSKNSNNNVKKTLESNEIERILRDRDRLGKKTTELSHNHSSSPFRPGNQYKN